jgi:predicted PurR-regulated permease PerM
MKNTILIICFVLLSFAILFIFVNGSEQRLNKIIIKSEQRIRDSLKSELQKVKAKNDSINASVFKMQSDFYIQSEKIKTQIQKLKFSVHVPKVDYNNVSDSALIIRISAN